MGSDCVPLHQESGRTMRWPCLGFLLLTTVVGVQLLSDETSEISLNKLRSEEKALADVYLPLVKREAEKKKKNGKAGKKKKSREIGKKQKTRRTLGNKKKKPVKKNGKKKTSIKNGNKKKIRKNGNKKKTSEVGNKKRKS